MFDIANMCFYLKLPGNNFCATGSCLVQIFLTTALREKQYQEFLLTKDESFQKFYW